MPAIKKAVALGRKNEELPKVVAKGHGHLATEIINKALDYNINIFSNDILTDALIKLELNENIPVELFQSVAELFAWLHNIEQSH